MVSITKTTGIVALVTVLAASSVYAKPSTSNTNSYNKNDPVKPYSITKEEDISDKIKDSIWIGNCLLSRIEFTNYYYPEDKKKEFLYKGCIFESDKTPEYPSIVNNAIKNDKLKEIVSAFYYNKEDIILLNCSIKKLKEGSYFALLLTNKKKPEKKFEIEMPVENEKN